MQDKSPYVGPRPFERKDGDKFFGRTREVNDLFSLMLSNRALLLYAQSGAGKTSLINASLVPRLEKEGFIIPPVSRVRGIIPDSIHSDGIKNIFVFSTLLSWLNDDDNPDHLYNSSIADNLENKLNPHKPDEYPPPYLLIFDQFEEIFTAYQDRWQDRIVFFQQLAEALEKHPAVRILLVMREEYIAQLQPFVRFLPGKLRVRYRLECLRKNAALAAIKNPLQQSSKDFKENVAETLVSNLLINRVESVDGKIISAPGEYVEPVQLQVVCQSLWSALPKDVTLITENHLQNFGDVTQALLRFYENAIRYTVKNSKIHEAKLRNWFSTKLITPAGTRGTVFRGSDDVGGIPHNAVQLLAEYHIIRGEFRAGARWYELTHDRFIEPIVSSNKMWLERSKTTDIRQWLSIRATQWMDGGNRNDDLLNEIELADATRWFEAAERNNGTNVQNIQAFITASRNELDREKDRIAAELAAAMRLRRLVAALIAAVIIVIILAGWATVAGERARVNEKAAQTSAIEANAANALKQQALDSLAQKNSDLKSARELAEENANAARASELEAQIERDSANVARLEADIQRDKAQAAEIIADSARQIAERQRNDLAQLRKSSVALILANEAERQILDNRSDRGILLARQAYLFDKDNLNQFRNAVFNSLLNVYNATSLNDLQKYPLIYLNAHSDWVRCLMVQPHGNHVVSAGNDGIVQVWRFSRDRLIPISQLKIDARVTSLSFAPDGNTLFFGDHTGQLYVITDIKNPKKKLSHKEHTASIYAIEFAPDGSYMATAGADQSTIIWDTKSKVPKPLTSILLKTRVKSLAFEPNRNLLLIGTENGDITIINLRQNIHDRNYDLLLEKQHNGAVNAIAVDPLIENRCATAGADGLVRIWRLSKRDNKLVAPQTLSEHTGPVNALAYNPNYNVLASAGSDRSIRLWNTKRPNEPPVVLSGHDRWVMALDFDSSGKNLVAGTAYKSIYLWPTRADYFANALCTRINRNMTEQEWKRFVGDGIEYQKTCQDK